MHEGKPSYIKNTMLLIIGVVSVGFSSILIKWCSAPASIMGMYRLFFTLVIITPMLRKLNLRSTLGELSRKEVILLLLSGSFLGIHFLFWMESLALTSVASSMIVLSLQPVFVMAGSFLLYRERTTGGGVIALSVAVIGSAVTAWGDIGLSKVALYGDLLSLLGAIAASLYMVTGQKLVRRIPPIMYSYMVFLIGGVIMLIYNLVLRVPLFSYDRKDWILFLLLAIVPNILGQMVFNKLMGQLGATTISMVIIAEPAVAIILATVLLHEEIESLQVMGGIITLLGVGLFFWFKQMMIKRGSKRLI